MIDDTQKLLDRRNRRKNPRREMQGGRDAAPSSCALAATTPPLLSTATPSSRLAATTAAIDMSTDEHGHEHGDHRHDHDHDDHGMPAVGSTSMSLVAAPATGALSLLQSANALGRLDAAPTPCAPPSSASSLAVDAPPLTGIDVASSSAPALDGDSMRSTLRDMVQPAPPPRYVM
jgi:hypothetical protein